MTLKELQEKNLLLPLFGIDDAAFSEYGRRISNMDTSDIIAVAMEKVFPQEGSVYGASDSVFEALPIAKQIQKEMDARTAKAFLLR